MWGASSGGITTATIGNNTIHDNVGRALQYQVNNGPIPSDIDETPAPTGNGSNAVWVAGQIKSSTTWQTSGYPIVVVGGYGLLVEEGSTLTLAPGLVLKQESITSKIDVWGNLIAAGTSTQPITVTSVKDDTVAGDTNGDGGATAPAAQDWEAFWSAIRVALRWEQPPWTM